jgi:hypothetical protein
MADNVTLPASSGTFSAASDDVGGVQYQRIKLDIGGDGVASPIERGTSFNLNSAATTNATLVATGARSLIHIAATNTGGAAAYLKLYNKATAPTVGTDVPVLTLTIPTTAQDGYGFGLRGQPFSLGIAFAITNLAADTDTTAVAASQVKVLGLYV